MVVLKEICAHIPSLSNSSPICTIFLILYQCIRIGTLLYRGVTNSGFSGIIKDNLCKKIYNP